MNKKMAALALVSVMLMASFCFLLPAGPLQIVSALGSEVTIPNVDHMIVEGVRDPVTVDPAWAYDTASAELIFNVYEPLIQFDSESVENFIPCLATEWTISPDGLTYTFTIREGVKFHDGTIVTVEDVEYSFEHILVQDRSGGPGWMFFEPLFGVYHSHHLGDIKYPDGSPGPDAATVGHMLDNAVEALGNQIVFHLATTYPPFLQVLSQSWASILNKDFCVANGDWPGWIDYEQWVYYDDPTTAPLDVAGHVMCGTGPYKLDYWTHGVEWSIVKFDDYWQGWPAWSCSYYLERATVKVVYEWGTRLADFRAGTADMVYVPRAFISQVEGWPGIRGIKDLPTLTVGVACFNFDISMPSPYVGSGALDGNGIPPDFFSDIHVRKAFAHAFNHTKYIEDVWLDEAQTPPSPHIRGLAYSRAVWDGTTNPIYGYLAPVPIRDIDFAKVEEEMKLAFGGTLEDPGPVWTNGFEMTITYNAGNVPRQTAALTFSENMAAVNPDFVISTTAVTWSTYLGELWYAPGDFRSLMPLFIMGKSADYPDPHNFVQPFQHSQGDFAYPSSYYNPTVDAWIEAGIAESDPDEREKIYHDIAWSYYNDQPSIALYQPLGRHWERDWVQGWYYNPVRPGYYFYHLWKGLNGDVNGDGAVDIWDYVKASAYWFSPSGPLGYNRKADIWPPLQFMGDLAPDSYLPQDEFGVPLPSIGEVDVFDLADMNYHWGEWTWGFPARPCFPSGARLSVDTAYMPGFLDIYVDDVEEMWGYQLKVVYDTDVLTATAVYGIAPFEVPLPLWEPGGGEINDAEGYVEIGFSYPLGEPTGLTTTDPVWIATVEFAVDGPGASPLQIENSIIANILGDCLTHLTMCGEFRTDPGLPLAKFSWMPETAFIDEGVIFTSESTDPDGTIVSWDWNFGDGTTGTGEETTHTYNELNDYMVTLTVTDNDGNTDSHSDVIAIRENPTIVQAQQLIETIETSDLPTGTENSLTSQLDAAVELITRGNENGAIHKLMDFMKKVEAMREKKLTNEQADNFISEAQKIIDLIQKQSP